MKDPDKKNLGIRYAKRICDSCGKTWMLRIDTDGWAYKLPDKNHYAYFCSWGCLRAWEKTHHTQTNSRQIWK